MKPTMLVVPKRLAAACQSCPSHCGSLARSASGRKRPANGASGSLGSWTSVVWKCAQ